MAEWHDEPTERPPPPPAGRSLNAGRCGSPRVQCRATIGRAAGRRGLLARRGRRGVGDQLGLMSAAAESLQGVAMGHGSNLRMAGDVAAARSVHGYRCSAKRRRGKAENGFSEHV